MTWTRWHFAGWNNVNRRLDGRAWEASAIAGPTSIDVARAAGVSQSTVSLVLSGKGDGRVSAATQETVRAAAAALGYRPNVAARRLKTGSSRAVGLVVPDVTNPFFGRVLRGAQRAAQERRYVVALVDTDSRMDWEQDAVQALRGGAVDGFLLFVVRSPASPADLAEPVVLVDTEQEGFSSVRLDSEGGARAAAEHLLALGHVRFGHLTSARDAPPFDRRRLGLEQTLEAAGLDPTTVVREGSAFTLDAAQAAGARLLTRSPRPTAVVCDDDILAAGLVLAAREAGVAIPAELSVVGFDDLDHARLVDPPLTTLWADGEALGAAAFELLADCLEVAPRSTEPRRIVHDVRLVVRGSTAAASD